MKEELKNCPFCDGKADIIITATKKIVFCTNEDCPMDDSWCYKTEEDAIKAWNTRANIN